MLEKGYQEICNWGRASKSESNVGTTFLPLDKGSELFQGERREESVFTYKKPTTVL